MNARQPRLETQHAPAPRGAPWHQRGVVRALAAAVIFVVGAALGGVIVGFAMNGSKPPLPQRRVAATKVPGAPQVHTGARAPVAGAAAVNNGCLRVINDGQTAYSGLQRLAAALRALDAARIDQVLLELQARQQQLQQDLGACHVSSRVATAKPSPSRSGG